MAFSCSCKTTKIISANISNSETCNFGRLIWFCFPSVLGRIPCPGPMGHRSFLTPSTQRRPWKAPAASLVYCNARVWINTPTDPDKSQGLSQDDTKWASVKFKVSTFEVTTPSSLLRTGIVTFKTWFLWPILGTLIGLRWLFQASMLLTKFGQTNYRPIMSRAEEESTESRHTLLASMHFFHTDRSGLGTTLVAYW